MNRDKATQAKRVAALIAAIDQHTLLDAHSCDYIETQITAYIVKEEWRGAWEGAEGFVYFLTWEGAGLIKIGFTKRDIQQRMKSYMAHRPSGDFRVLSVIEAPREVEGKLHRLLLPWRVHSEWFSAAAVAVLLRKWVALRPESVCNRHAAIGQAAFQLRAWQDTGGARAAKRQADTDRAQAQITEHLLPLR